MQQIYYWLSCLPWLLVAALALLTVCILHRRQERAKEECREEMEYLKCVLDEPMELNNISN